MASRRFHLVQLDVFTSRPLEGNQLAVIPDAHGLSDDEMQKLARETNLSETTFILPREEAVERAEGHKVRIFTVNEELPFLLGTPRSVPHGICGNTPRKTKSSWISGSAKFLCGSSRAMAGCLARCGRRSLSSGVPIPIRKLQTCLEFRWRNWMKICRFKLSPPECRSPWCRSVRWLRYRS